MKKINIFIFLSFIVTHTVNGLTPHEKRCLNVYNDCMRPKVLDRTKVTGAWIRQHQIDADLKNEFKGLSACQNTLEKTLAPTSDSLWDFKIQNESVTISPPNEEYSDPSTKCPKFIEYPNYKQKCTDVYKNCLSAGGNSRQEGAENKK